MTVTGKKRPPRLSAEERRRRRDFAPEELLGGPMTTDRPDGHSLEMADKQPSHTLATEELLWRGTETQGMCKVVANKGPT